MKKSILLFVVLIFNFSLFAFNCFAQPNGGFEDWTLQYNAYENPDNWQTLNVLSILFPADQLSAFKATGLDKHSGNYALKIKSIFINSNPAPQQLRDTMGYAFLGNITMSPPSLKLGIPYTGRPEKLEFWSKYIPVGKDIAGVNVVLKTWNGTSSDTTAYGFINIDTTLTYTFFQVYLGYRSNAMSDTLIISFGSSDKKSRARVGSTLYIDDVSLTGWVGIDEHDNFADKVKIFPNPAKESVTILTQIEEAENVQVIDISGKFKGVYKIQNYKTNINTRAFACGIYFYEIRDDKNKILIKGKFSVAK